MVVDLYDRLDRQRLMSRRDLQSFILFIWLPVVTVLSAVAFTLGSGSARADSFRLPKQLAALSSWALNHSRKQDFSP